MKTLNDQPSNRTSRAFLRLAGVLVLLTGCGRHPLRLQLEPTVERPEKSVVLFFVDGLDRGHLNQFLAQGRLPTIQRLFVDGGVGVQHAVTSIPAMTYPNTVSLLTGRFPGHHGIVGNQWFDRRTLASTDYIRPSHYQTVNHDFRDPTIYEMLNDHFTISIQCHTHRGANIAETNEVPTGLAWAVGLFQSIDQLSAGSLEEIGDYVNRAGRWPSLLTFYFPGIDEIGHLSGSDSSAYASAVENIDRQIQRVTDALAREHLLERTTLILVSDHSHPDVHATKSVDLVGWLRKERRLHVHRGEYFARDYITAFDHFENYDAIVIDGSFRRIYVHLKGSRGWSRPVSAEEVSRCVSGGAEQDASPLWKLPGVELVCTSPAPGTVHVFSRRGAALIERKMEEKKPMYRIVPWPNEPNDPLQISDNATLSAFAAAGWHTSREWLAALASTNYPDFIPQIVEAFDSPRTGEFVVFSARDWAFEGHDRGEHGSCLPEDMLIPMYFAGPGLPKGSSIPNARLVDLTPTVLDLLGEGDRIATYSLDGESIADKLRQAAPSRWDPSAIR
ncbi:MAG TPA: alkaline phosphatase family protein [Phycisphaerae bacterium]|nr:alkaline phosphatase family protein [Phycisphaerae bacterium]